MTGTAIASRSREASDMNDQAKYIGPISSHVCSASRGISISERQQHFRAFPTQCLP